MATCFRYFCIYVQPDLGGNDVPGVPIHASNTRGAAAKTKLLFARCSWFDVFHCFRVLNDPKMGLCWTLSLEVSWKFLRAILGGLWRRLTAQICLRWFKSSTWQDARSERASAASDASGALRRASSAQGSSRHVQACTQCARQLRNCISLF